MIFLDTSFIISYYNKEDNNHDEAAKVMNKILKEKCDVCISDFIFDECATIFFLRLKDLRKAIEICKNLKKIILFYTDKNLFESGWDIFIKQVETKLSFTDCHSIAVMKKEGINKIATFDEDFKKIKEIEVFK